MINEKKIPDEIQPAKPNWRRRLLISALKSPISTILILAFLYFAFQAYVLQLSPTVNKFYMFGVLFLWGFWAGVMKRFQDLGTYAREDEKKKAPQ